MAGTAVSRWPRDPVSDHLPAVLTRVLETVAPTRLGRSFRLLLSSDVVNNLGDGIVLAAGPLLVASQTRDPLLVSMALLLQRLPFLLFGFLAGAIADRLDRRRIVVLVDLLRAGVLATLATTIVTGTVSIWVVLTAMFVLGTAETFADTAARTLLPSIVDRMDLGIGNARLQSSYLLANQMAGPPIGALLFAAGAAWPFVVNAGALVGHHGPVLVRLRGVRRARGRPVARARPHRARQRGTAGRLSDRGSRRPCGLPTEPSAGRRPSAGRVTSGARAGSRCPLRTSPRRAAGRPGRSP